MWKPQIGFQTWVNSPINKWNSTTEYQWETTSGLKHEPELAKCHLNWREAFTHIKNTSHVFVSISSSCTAYGLKLQKGGLEKCSIPPCPAQQSANSKAWKVILKP